MSADAIERLTAHAWPGNVRELENLVERLVILAPNEEIDPDTLDRFVPRLAAGPSPLEIAQERLVPLRELEAMYIAWVVAQYGGDKTRAAEVLGIDVSTIHRRERERSQSQ